MIEMAVSDTVVARLEALTARLDEQAAEIANLKVQTAGLKAENARLTAARSTSARPTSKVTPTTNRRGMLRTALGASAAAALLMVAKEAPTAEANANATIVGPSTASYGVLASPGGNVFAPTFGATTHGVVGSNVSGGPTVPFGTGVLGVRLGAGLAGVLGWNQADGPGVVGITESASGVRGTASSGTGVEGISNTGDGILGYSSGNLKYSLAGSGSGQAHGLIGNSANQFGIAGINQNGNNWAGAFFNAQANTPNSGKQGLFVQGDFVVVNGTKNAAVKTQKHGYRKLYAVEATVNVFEDIDTGRLQNGRAQIDLEEVFSETVNTGAKYQVFLTPKSADSKGLAVTQQGPKGFTVQELGGGTGSYEFDYRIVAKVKGLENKRLEQFEPPKMPEPPPAPSRLDQERPRPQREGADN